jgi:DNA-binding ferritin-like protein
VRLLSPRFAAQRDFNARQVELDNQMLAYLGARFAATHENYDRLLGALGGRLDEIDERHRRLEAELQAHVRDVVERVDLVLEESTKGRLAGEFALEDLRARLARLEEALRRRDG